MQPSRQPKGGARLSFFPRNAPVPTGLRTDQVLLVPLRPIHVKPDYDAVMTSREMLRRWSQSDWPADDFTLQDNLDDLERHEREHIELQAFTYAVLDPTETECLGCVYIKSLMSELNRAKANTDEHMEKNDRTAVVRFWVRQSRLADDLDRHLLDALVAWFDREWPFEAVLFRTAGDDRRQATVFTGRGLEIRHELKEPGLPAPWLFYG